MSLTNNAVWLDAIGQKLRIGPADIVRPGKREVMIRVHAVAMNPIDYVQQDTGLFLQTFPAILGFDAAGEVIEVGEDVPDLSPGQRVLAHAGGIINRKNENSAFQNILTVRALSVAPIPDSMSYEEASVLPIAVSTAAAGLYWAPHLSLSLPSLDPKPRQGTLLLWGGSSSMGTATIQLATASGVDVVTTCSPRNFSLCQSLGAKKVFDHNSPNVVKELISALEGKDCVGAYDGKFKIPERYPQSPTTQYLSPDTVPEIAIGSPETETTIAQVLDQLGGGKIACVRHPPENLPKRVKSAFFSGDQFVIQDEATARAVWKDFLPAALTSKQFRSAPPAQVVGKGLEDVQLAIDTLRKGVSGKKIVVLL